MRLAPQPPAISGAPQLTGLPLNPDNPRSAKVDAADGATIVTGSSIYTSGDNLLYSIDKVTDKIQWFFKTTVKIKTSPCLANNVLYIGSDDGHLYAIDAQNGTKLWDYTTGDKIESSPAFANGVIYFGSNDGKMYAIK
jgi:outer membrane protein assembly factor BamB